MTRAAATLGMQHDFAAALLDPQRAAPAGVRAWNGSDPAVRLAVHRNNVLSSLVDALAETFPVVQQLVGAEFFRAMAGCFVRQTPPRSRVLAHYGQGMPGFIAAFEPAQGLPYLADVARLELARIAAYHAADAEPVSDERVALALASGERMGELRLVLHPSVCTVSSRYAIVGLWAAHQADDDSEIGAVDVDVPESALILRFGLDVLVLPTSRATVDFAEAVRAGRPLAEAAAVAASGVATDAAKDAAKDAAPSGAEFDLTATLTQLLAHGALSAIHLPQRLPS